MVALCHGDGGPKGEFGWLSSPPLRSTFQIQNMYHFHRMEFLEIRGDVADAVRAASMDFRRTALGALGGSVASWGSVVAMAVKMAAW